MMSEAWLQILLILAFLAIGLISVTFPIYAICVTYLRQEKWETEKERKERINKLKENIAKLTKELTGEKKDSERFAQIEERIKNHRDELKNLELRVKFLTAKGAVRDPIVSLIIALLVAVAGILFLYAGLEQYLQYVVICVLGSAFSSGVALYYLYETISAVEYSALRQARTLEFEVCWDTGEISKKIKEGKETDLSVGACAEESVEKFEMFVCLPPEIELKRVLSAEAHTTLQPKKSSLPLHTAIIMPKDFVPKNVFQAIDFTVLVKKTGKYQIPVILYAKGIYEYGTELTLNVVK